MKTQPPQERPQRGWEHGSACSAHATNPSPPFLASSSSASTATADQNHSYAGVPSNHIERTLSLTSAEPCRELKLRTRKQASVENVSVENTECGMIPESVKKNYPGKWYCYNFADWDMLYVAAVITVYLTLSWYGVQLRWRTLVEATLGALLLLLILRSLPQLSFSELARAERRVLAHINTRLHSYWTSFRYKGVDWCIHSVCTHKEGLSAIGQNKKPDIVVGKFRLGF